MAKLVVRKIDVKNGRSGARPGVKKTRVRDSAGQPMQVYTLDVRSSTFGDDLTYVYQANVAAARNENRKLFGSEDGPKDRNKNGKLLISAGARHGRRKK
jgi:hypothetical protein